MPKLTLTMLAIGLLGLAVDTRTATAQFPNWKAVPVRPNIDVIPPLGNRLPRSYAAKYNRPSYLTGRLAYTFAPSSQEAMAWQQAHQRGYYANHAPRMETQFYYPKPWEVLREGRRPQTAVAPDSTVRTGPPMPRAYERSRRTDSSGTSGSDAEEPQATEPLAPGQRAIDLAPAIELPALPASQ